MTRKARLTQLPPHEEGAPTLWAIGIDGESPLKRREAEHHPLHVSLAFDDELSEEQRRALEEEWGEERDVTFQFHKFTSGGSGELPAYIAEGEPLNIPLPNPNASIYASSHFYLDDYPNAPEPISDAPLPHTTLNPAAAFETADEGYDGVRFPRPPTEFTRPSDSDSGGMDPGQALRNDGLDLPRPRAWCSDEAMQAQRSRAPAGKSGAKGGRGGAPGCPGHRTVRFAAAFATAAEAAASTAQPATAAEAGTGALALLSEGGTVGAAAGGLAVAGAGAALVGTEGGLNAASQNNMQESGAVDHYFIQEQRRARRQPQVFRIDTDSESEPRNRPLPQIRARPATAAPGPDAFRAEQHSDPSFFRQRALPSQPAVSGSHGVFACSAWLSPGRESSSQAPPVRLGDRGGLGGSGGRGGCSRRSLLSVRGHGSRCWDLLGWHGFDFWLILRSGRSPSPLRLGRLCGLGLRRRHGSLRRRRLRSRLLHRRRAVFHHILRHFF